MIKKYSKLLFSKKKNRFKIITTEVLSLKKKTQRSRRKYKYCTLDSIIESKMIQGENKRYVNPLLFPYLLAIRVKWVIINPFLIQKSIIKCLKLVGSMIQKRQKILIIGNSFDIRFLLSTNLHLKKNPFIFFYNDTWLSGGLTNQQQQSRRLKIFRFNKFSLIIFLKTRTNRHDLFREMVQLNIPVISLIPTNFNFLKVNKILYPIVLNCYSTKSLFFFLYLLRKLISQKLKNKYETL